MLLFGAHVFNEFARYGGGQFQLFPGHRLKIGITSMYCESNQAAF
jgi:hypothetical protein